jgi:hypothetical protein
VHAQGQGNLGDLAADSATATDQTQRLATELLERKCKGALSKTEACQSGEKRQDISPTSHHAP